MTNWVTLCDIDGILDRWGADNLEKIPKDHPDKKKLELFWLKNGVRGSQKDFEPEIDDIDINRYEQLSFDNDKVLALIKEGLTVNQMAKRLHSTHDRVERLIYVKNPGLASVMKYRSKLRKLDVIVDINTWEPILIGTAKTIAQVMDIPAHQIHSSISTGYTIKRKYRVYKAEEAMEMGIVTKQEVEERIAKM